MTNLKRKLKNPLETLKPHSKISSRTLTDFDIELLHRLVCKFHNNEVLKVLYNEKYYSKDTIETYKKLAESCARITKAIKLKREEVEIDEIPTSW